MKYLSRALALAVVASILAATGLSAASAGGPDDGPRRPTYEVVVTNVTDNQILTPPVFAAHTARADVFDLGAPASAALAQLAENGDLAPLVAALDGMRGVRTSGIGDGEGGPLPPGAEATFTFRAPRGARLLTTAQMVVCTNDGFTGADSLRLPVRKGHTTTLALYAFDAGTETNTDALDDFVPPCSGETTGTGTSNPDLSEGGVIAPHPGLSGEAAEMWAFDADAPVAMLEVTRVR